VGFEPTRAEPSGLAGNLLNFLEEEYFIESVNGYSITLKHIPIKKSGVTEIYLSDDEIREGYEKVRDDFKTVYKLLVYSGGRFQHVHTALETFSPELEQ